MPLFHPRSGSEMPCFLFLGLGAPYAALRLFAPTPANALRQPAARCAISEVGFLTEWKRGVNGHASTHRRPLRRKMRPVHRLMLRACVGSSESGGEGAMLADGDASRMAAPRLRRR